MTYNPMPVMLSIVSKTFDGVFFSIFLPLIKMHWFFTAVVLCCKKQRWNLSYAANFKST